MMMPEKIVSAGLPLRSGSNDYLKGDLGYKLQETAGIYGFMEGQTRKSLGMGAYDFEPDRPVLQSASEGYGSTRAFWDLNLGGMGDLPLPSEGALGNIELSEIARRFVPHKRSTVNMLNPIKNTMGKKYPFLPGSENFTDFTTGDPFTKVPEGEMRLPGIGYERLNKLYPDRNGRYGAVNQLDILADVAPYSKEYRNLDRRIDKIGLSEEERAIELINKKLGLGKWAVGGTKLIYAYDKDYYDLEREKRLAAGIIDFPGSSNGILDVPLGQEYDNLGFVMNPENEGDGYDNNQHRDDDNE
jgi:hypothetical protein